MAYYVTLQHRGPKGSQWATCAGPYRRHGDAIAARGAATVAAYRHDPRTAWDSFGTTHAPTRHDRRGVLNDAMGLAVDADGFVIVPDPPRLVVDHHSTLYGRGPAPRGYVTCDGDAAGCRADDAPHYHPLTEER